MMTTSSEAHRPENHDTAAWRLTIWRQKGKKARHLEAAVEGREGGAELVDGDGAIAVGIYAAEELLQAVDLVLAQAFGHDHQCSLLELVHGRQLLDARQHHAVQRLVCGRPLCLQPWMLHAKTATTHNPSKIHPQPIVKATLRHTDGIMHALPEKLSFFSHFANSNNFSVSKNFSIHNDFIHVKYTAAYVPRLPLFHCPCL